MDYDKLAAQLLRALRGGRSQEEFSRLLGFRSNVAYAWESGRRFPTASRLLLTMEGLGKTAGQVLSEFFGHVAPGWIETAAADRATVTRLLVELRGERSIAALARESGLSRFAIGRAFSGESDPRLPDFLRLIAATSRRLMDLIAVLVDPADVPEAREQWKQVSSLRSLAYDYPASEAVLCALELVGYSQLSRHEDRWVAELLDLDVHVVGDTLRALSRSGVIRWTGRRWQVEEDRYVDTRSDRDAVERLKKHWVSLAASSVGQRPGLYSYVVFSVSAETLRELREQHLAYYSRVRELISRSQNATEVCVASLNMFQLGGTDGIL
jgi:DNA-binding phage protein